MNMMPIQPFWLDLMAIFLAFTGFVALALASEREGKSLLHRKLMIGQRRSLRIVGALLLLVSLAVGIAGWYPNYGVFLWFGWLTVAATALVFAIPYWPWRQTDRERRQRPAPNNLKTLAVPPPLRFASHGLLMLGLVAIPLGFAWALNDAPIHSLLRDEALKGRVGPWTFTIAEEEQAPPVEIGNDTIAKHVVLRFCDACDSEIRDAYLKVRKPRLPLAVGLGFGGVRWEREVTLVIPPGATVDDGIWLTVVGTDGAVHQAEIAVAALSPATARFLRERSQ